MKEIIEALSLAIAIFYTTHIVIHLINYILKIWMITVSGKGHATFDVTRETIIETFGEPTVIWGSPVCSAWSKTGWFSYWDTNFYRETKRFKPKKDFATESVEMVRKTIEIFSWFPNATFFMENPEGLLYRHPVINTFLKYGLMVDRKRVTYCQYGDTIRKPTHIWTNSTKWKPRPICKNGDPCHESSPRCTQKGILSKKNAYDRSKIPAELCFEILHSCGGGLEPNAPTLNFEQSTKL